VLMGVSSLSSALLEFYSTLVRPVFDFRGDGFGTDFAMQKEGESLRVSNGIRMAEETPLVCVSGHGPLEPALILRRLRHDWKVAPDTKHRHEECFSQPR
jgi:hypothetical protein